MKEISEVFLMSDLVDLLVEVSPSLKVGWGLWFAAGLALAASFRLARVTPLPARPLPAGGHAVPLADSQKEPWNLPDAPVMPPMTASALPEPTQWEGHERPSKKSRSLRRKGVSQ
jgi:hypothetical protein